MKPSTGTRDEAADHAAEPERRELEEDASAGSALVGAIGGLGTGPRSRGRPLQPRSRARPSGACASAVPAPSGRGPRGTRRRARSTAPTRDDRPRDDEPDEQHDDADGEADRPEARAGDVRMFVVLGSKALGIQADRQHAGQRRAGRSNYAGSGRLMRAGTVRDAVLGPAAVDERADLRGSSRSPAATRGRPRPGPSRSRRSRACRRRTAASVAWSRWSAGPSVSTTSRAGSTFAPDVEQRPARSRAGRRARRRR